MICIVYALLYDNYMSITWQLYVKYKVITRMAFSKGVFPFCKNGFSGLVGCLVSSLAKAYVQPTLIMNNNFLW